MITEFERNKINKILEDGKCITDAGVLAVESISIAKESKTITVWFKHDEDEYGTGLELNKVAMVPKVFTDLEEFDQICDNLEEMK